MINKIVIIAGDPNSINSEIIFKSWKKLPTSLRKKITILGCFELLNKQSKELKLKVPMKKINKINDKNFSNSLNILNFPLKFKNCFNVPIKSASIYLINCLNYAHNLSQNKKIKGFINCPINKKLIKKKGIFGVTEFVAKKSKTKNAEVMFLYNKRLSVVPITTHIKVKEISKKINKRIIIKKINTINKSYKKFFNKKPKIALLGLNPHNDELSGSSEEKKIIIPAIRILKKKINIKGPLSADSFFVNQFKNFDVIVGMYHDQVLIPFKNMFKFDAVNMTLGLDYLRLSPDHGTATNIIKKNKANSDSLISCIKLINIL